MKSFIALLLLVTLSIVSVNAQTSAFTYQGSLKDGGVAANGSYDFEFRLYDAGASGIQVGSVVTRNAVAVEAGTFSILLDFGASSFTGADRWVEVWVRPVGSGGGFQQLLPRNRIASTPYAVQSLNAATATTATNATQLAGVAGNQYVVTTDPRMTDARTPTAGSANYIQNQNAGAQASSNFNISGNGTAGGTLSGNVLNATTQLNINGVRGFTINGLFSSPGFQIALSNTFAGVGAGVNNVPDASLGSSLGKRNAFFGVYAGFANTSGYSNSFYGASSGESNTSGSLNAFYGHRSGESNTFGDSNSFFGVQSGGQTTSGANNTFIGRNSGALNTTGSNNSALGNLSIVNGNLQYATAIGAESEATISNSIYLGRPKGEDTVRIPGNFNLTGSATVNGNFVHGSGGLALFNSNVSLTSLGTAGATSLCRNASNLISTCSSSLKYKSNINRFGFGLSLIKKLNPITFDWKEGGMHDLGLGAEDVAAIEPLLVNYNAKGEVEGVKYDRIGVVLINAVKEQQAVIESQKKRLDEQSDRIDALTRLLCKTASDAEICKEKQK